MIDSADEFVRLREANDPRATYDTAPSQVWLDVVHRYPTMREWVTHNKSVPIEVLAILACDGDSRIRAGVAMKRKCPERTLEILAHDPDPSVRIRVAYNANTSSAVMRMMLNDTSLSVREAVQRFD